MPQVAKIAGRDPGTFYDLSIDDGNPHCTCPGFQHRNWCRHVESLGISFWRRPGKDGTMPEQEPIVRACGNCGMDTGGENYLYCRQCEWYMFGGDGVVPEIELPTPVESTMGVCSICGIEGRIASNGNCVSQTVCQKRQEKKSSLDTQTTVPPTVESTPTDNVETDDIDDIDDVDDLPPLETAKKSPKQKTKPNTTSTQQNITQWTQKPLL